VRVAPFCLVDDVDQVVNWYVAVFGARIQARLPEQPPFEWVSLRLGDVEIMFSRKDSVQEWYSDRVKVSDAPANFIAYIYVTGADELWDRVRDRVLVLMEPTDQPYGIREFAIQDPFGFSLIFAEILE